MSKTHTGEILEIREIQTVSDTFQKRRFVVDEVYKGGQYGPSHNPVPFFLTQEKCGLIDEFKVGQHVTVHYDLKSRPWIKDGVHQLDKHGYTSYFVEVQAWKLEPVVAESATPQDQAPTEQEMSGQAPTPGNDFSQAPPQSGAAGQGEDQGPDDLPF